MSLFSERKDVCPDKLCYRQNIPVCDKSTKKEKLQVVPPFSIQSLRRKNVIVEPFVPKDRIILKPYPVGNTLFRKCYERGDFPIIMVFDPSLGQKIAWKVNIKEIDYQYFLPVFFNGLCEIEYPYNFYAQQGIEDLLYFGGRQKVLPAVPQLILPIKNALNTKNRAVIGQTLKIIQAMLTCVGGVGVALIPYYRQILPPLNMYKEMNANTGQEIDYGQQKRENIGELVQETLEMLEKHGGEDAYINIKYLIPTYESTLSS
ncbi:parkin coregulated gene protein homolog [Halyomorpha halys]|uniref:parkin coregulated gene protein homolog n=1 Tax=Halyomorpha halys TaxID=286706 RepID=UPI0006D4E6F3|nr:parkin coregulated gene protein homolog [Halyomorpha halys]